MLALSVIIMYMKKFLHSDWLTAVQFFFKTVQKRVNSVQKEETNQAFWLVNDQRNSQMAQSNFLFSNQAHALDGAIFPWLRDTRAFLLLNHLEIFSYILLRPQIALTPRARAILLVFEKFTRVYLFQIAQEKSCDYLYKPGNWYGGIFCYCNRKIGGAGECWIKNFVASFK